MDAKWAFGSGYHQSVLSIVVRWFTISGAHQHAPQSDSYMFDTALRCGLLISITLTMCVCCTVGHLLDGPI
jgi:hypothetical protein